LDHHYCLVEFERLFEKLLDQIPCLIQPGNSGGALCNERGQVVGVISSALVSTSSVVQFQNVNYAIKSSVAREFLSKTPADQKIATASENSLKAIAIF
jgi:S1-C subfamily serine protease